MVLMAPGRAGSKELSAFADQIILSDCYRIVKYFLWEMFDFLKIMGVYSACYPAGVMLVLRQDGNPASSVRTI